MATSRNAWGIDVGNRALKAVRVSRDGDGFRIDDFEVIEHETPLSQSGDNRDALIAKSLTEFVQRHKTGSVPVGVAVSGQQSFARFVKLPPVEEKKIPEIVRFEAVQQIPFPLDDVEFAWQLFRKKDDPDIEVGLFAMRKELVNRHVEAYTDVNLNVQVVQMSPLAVYNAMWFDGKLADGTTLIIDMGADTTDLVVADGEQIWHRSIPIGGNNFTETLVRGFKLDYAKAEAMKREASTSKYARQIFQAMRPVFADLVAEIQRSVGFYSSTHRDTKLTKAIALGGTFKLPGLQKYLQQNLQLDVERIEAFSAAAPTDAKLLANYTDNVLSSATAYGLAVQAMGEGKVTSSLLPGHIRQAKVWKDKTKWFAASAALFVAAAGISVVGAYLPKVQWDSASEERSKIETALNEGKRLDGEWSSIESAGESDRTVIRNVMMLSADRTLWPRLSSTIRHAVPTDPAIAKNDLAALKATPRGERKLIQLENWESIFLPNVGVLLSDAKRARFLSEVPAASVAPDFGGGAPPSDAGLGGGFGGPPGYAGGGGFGGAGGGFGFGNRGGSGSAGLDAEVAEVPKDVVTAATGKSGFLLRITGVTPNQQASRLLDQTFLHDLLATRYAAEGTKVDFYVADAFLVRQGLVKDDPARLQAMLKSYLELQKFKSGQPAQLGGGQLGGGQLGGEPGPGGFPGGFGGGLPPGGAGGAPGVDDPTPYLDPLTGEDTRGDKHFSLLVFVVLGQPAAPAPAAPANP